MYKKNPNGSKKKISAKTSHIPRIYYAPAKEYN